MQTRMRIAIGPCQYFWPREALDRFYDDVADSAADIVYLGETVCAKRREYRPEDWIAMGRELAAEGKGVVLSSLTLIEARSELGVVRKICDNGDFLVEANDVAAVQLLRERGLPFVAGPMMNIYNAAALTCYRRLGLQRWVTPVELGGQALSAILETAALPGLETEVLAHGPLPLAWSARCFTARYHDLPKDQCGLRCIEHPEGIPVHTRDGERFLTINGIQTQSGLPVDLLPVWEELQHAGADIIRISPAGNGTAALVNELAAAIGGDTSARQRIASRNTQGCNGYWYGQPGMYQQPPGGFTDA